jgi:hypothetical protein
MATSDNSHDSGKSTVEILFDKASRFVDDLGTVGKVAFIPGILIALIIPTSIEQLKHPEQLFYLAAIKTMPLTITIGIVVVSLCTPYIKNGLHLLILWAFSIVLCASIADYYGCVECGDRKQIEHAFELSREWTPKWFADSAGPLNAIPFLLACLVAFYQLYGTRTFLAAIVCGLYLGFAALYLMRPVSQPAQVKKPD